MPSRCSTTAPKDGSGRDGSHAEGRTSRRDRAGVVRAPESKITHIGRGLAAHVRFEDQRVSRDHAIIVRHGRFARLLDNRSANGTFVNGRRVVVTNLQDGDVIRVGPIAVQYVELD